MKRLGLTSVVCALLTSACSTATTASPVPLDRSFTASGFRISEGSKVGVYMKAIPSQNGIVRICGAWQLQSNSPRAGRIAESFLFGAKLYLSDVEVLTRLSYFAEIPLSAPLAGQSAKCRDTQTPWRTDFATARLHPVYPRSAFSLSRHTHCCGVTHP